MSSHRIQLKAGDFKPTLRMCVDGVGPMGTIGNLFYEVAASPWAYSGGNGRSTKRVAFALKTVPEMETGHGTQGAGCSDHQNVKIPL